MTSYNADLRFSFLVFEYVTSEVQLGNLRKLMYRERCQAIRFSFISPPNINREKQKFSKNKQSITKNEIMQNKIVSMSFFREMRRLKGFSIYRYDKQIEMFKINNNLEQNMRIHVEKTQINDHKLNLLQYGQLFMCRCVCRFMLCSLCIQPPQLDIFE